MPNSSHFYQPDQIDCRTMVTALAEDFGVLVDIVTLFEPDYTTVVVKCRKPDKEQGWAVHVQSKFSVPIRSTRPLVVMMYRALLDCYYQLDRGSLGLTPPSIPYGWNGRPSRPTRSGKR